MCERFCCHRVVHLSFGAKTMIKCRLSLHQVVACLFYSDESFIRQNYPFPKQALVFMCLKCKSFENTTGKGEIARNEQFLLFPQCFLLVWRAFCHFQQI